ncbi:MAG: pyridoxine 5'-phosphate synthase [Pyrinomonadaceae bacterium]|nr:pyridoxine 5'-phosphate synthase [Pyrinomonadaceae bacterium]
MGAKLSVNLNKVALLRNARTIGIPSVVRAAEVCIEAGAHGITVHPRPDERHIRRQDVFDLAEALKAAPEVEFNIEGNPFPEFMELVLKVKPTQCTLVPDSPEAFTSDHGWDLKAEGERLKPIINQLKQEGIRTSLFMETDPEQIGLARTVGADRVELYTEPYAASFARGVRVEETLEAFRHAAEKAQSVWLGVNAGHDLNLQNLGLFCSIPNIMEVSIGHALISDALEMGLANTVRAYLKVLDEAEMEETGASRALAS